MSLGFPEEPDVESQSFVRRPLARFRSYCHSESFSTVERQQLRIFTHLSRKSVLGREVESASLLVTFFV